MRIVTLNVNGIRSAERKGLSRWLGRVEPWDVVCLQEIKAAEEEVPRTLKAPRKAHGFFRPATRRGYAGVALYAKRMPKVSAGFGSTEFDAEGRYLEADFGSLAVASVYLPSGSAGPHRQASKFRFLETFLPHLLQLRRQKREIILCGDWNIAHQAIDLKNWRSNQKNSGFLPEERAWLTRVFDELGFIDVFRRVNREPDRIHLVVEPRPVVGQQRGLAHRLSDCHARNRGHGTRRVNLQEPAFFRPCAIGHRL